MRPLLKGLAVTGGVLAVLITSAVAISYSSGPGSCTYPTSGMGSSGNGTGGFVIEVSQDGGTVAEYVPGATYTVTLSAPEAYTGFLLQSVAGAPGQPDQNGVGAFTNLAEGYRSGPCSVAASSVGHTRARRNAPVTSDTFEWVAPAEGTGDVTFHAVGVYSRFDWYGESELIVTTLTEGAATVSQDASDFSTLKARYQ